MEQGFNLPYNAKFIGNFTQESPPSVIPDLIGDPGVFSVSQGKSITPFSLSHWERVGVRETFFPLF